jgi:DNA polymerase-3 subunit gamma/tau
LSKGFDGNHFIIGLASHLRNLLVGKDPATLHLLEVSEGIKQKYLAQSQQAEASFLVSALNIANHCDLNYRTSKNQRLQVELALIKIAHLPAVLQLATTTPPVEVKKKRIEPLTPAPSTTQSVANVTPEAVQETQVAVLTPAAVQTEEEVIDTPAASEPQEDPITEPEKPAASVPRTSFFTATPLIPNLNDLASAPLEEEKPDYLRGDACQPFSAEMLLNRWNAFAEKAKKENKINLFTLMTANPPVLLDNYQIELNVENKIQENQLQEARIDLMNYLRTELQNFQLDLATKIVENTENKRLYTSSEKYQYMVEKNPKLKEFKKRFNLDLEL